MANPRQRRKARSSSHKPVKQSRRANKLLRKQRPIRGPKAVQDAWDKHKTVRQNYAALGLVHSLKPCDSGGSERQREEEQDRAENSVTEINVGDTKSGMRKGFGRIVRDEKGNVVRVEIEEDGESLMEEDETAWCRANGSDWLLRESVPGSGEAQKEVGRALADAATGGTGRRRGCSAGAGRWLGELVSAHGGDVEAMARDRKRNAGQRTAGQLRRAIARWKASGTGEALT